MDEVGRLMLALLPILWVLCGLGAYVVARDRGFYNGFGWFLTGILFGPFGLLAAFVVAPPDDEDDQP